MHAGARLALHRRSWGWLAAAALLACAVAAPHVLMQYYAAALYCTPRVGRSMPLLERAATACLHMLGAPGVREHEPGSAIFAAQEPPWCAEYLDAPIALSDGDAGVIRSWAAVVRSAVSLPNVYAHVQRRHWGVGLMRYWQIKHTPQFFLAAPVLALALDCMVAFVQASHGLGGVFGAAYGTLAASSSVIKSQRVKRYLDDEVLRRLLFPHILLTAIMTVAALTIMNVQVATRFLAATPLLYWHAAGLLVAEPNAASPSIRLRLGLLHCLLYSLCGTVLFILYLPWT